MTQMSRKIKLLGLGLALDWPGVLQENEIFYYSTLYPSSACYYLFLFFYDKRMNAVQLRPPTDFMKASPSVCPLA